MIFTLAGGVLPLKVLPSTLGPRLYLFSYRSQPGALKSAHASCPNPGPLLEVTIDPYNPAINWIHDMDACQSTFEVTLYALKQIVHVRLTSDPRGYCEVTCPTSSGFQVRRRVGGRVLMKVKQWRSPQDGLFSTAASMYRPGE